jgi:hypothetical protein
MLDGIFPISEVAWVYWDEKRFNIQLHHCASQSEQKWTKFDVKKYLS